MLAKKVFDACVDFRVVSQRIAHAQIKFLIAGRKVPVGKQHSISEIGVREKRTVVASPYKITAQCCAKFLTIVKQGQTSGVRCAMEWPVAL